MKLKIDFNKSLVEVLSNSNLDGVKNIILRKCQKKIQLLEFCAVHLFKDQYYIRSAISQNNQRKIWGHFLYLKGFDVRLLTFVYLLERV